jgi:hypothetical protein
MTTLYTRHVSLAGAVSYRPWGAAYESAADWPAGFHLVHVAPGVTSTRYNVAPDAAPLLAAAKLARPTVISALLTALQPRPLQPLTAEQRRSLDGVTLLHRSPHDVYDEIVAALVRVVATTP